VNHLGHQLQYAAGALKVVQRRPILIEPVILPAWRANAARASIWGSENFSDTEPLVRISVQDANITILVRELAIPIANGHEASLLGFAISMD
jgi:hypothetical protein